MPAGPGKKQCDKCKEFVGVRTKECQCGFKFPVGAAKAASKKSQSPKGETPVESVVSVVKLLQEHKDKIGDSSVADWLATYDLSPESLAAITSMKQLKEFQEMLVVKKTIEDVGVNVATQIQKALK